MKGGNILISFIVNYLFTFSPFLDILLYIYICMYTYMYVYIYIYISKLYNLNDIYL